MICLSHVLYHMMVLYLLHQITLTIEVEEVNKKVEVVMREDAPVISAIYRAADKAAILPQLTHALYEVIEHLGIGKKPYTTSVYIHTH